MRITIVGHITIDILISGHIKTTTLGGPPSYAGIIAKEMGGDVYLLTKYGEDIPEVFLNWFTKNHLKICKDACSMTHHTTTFEILQTLSGREVYIKARCEDLSSEVSLDGDVAIVSPVAGEIDLKLLSNIRKKFEIVYLDPQGFIRNFASDGRCFLNTIEKGILEHVDIIKMDKDEVYLVTGSRRPLRALEEVIRKGIKIAIYTRGSEGILLRCSKGLFNIPIVRKGKIVDTTGLGDLFAGAYAKMFFECKDPVWSGCIAVAAASIGVSKVGLTKIPNINSVTEMAEEIMSKTRKIE